MVLYFFIISSIPFYCIITENDFYNASDAEMIGLILSNASYYKVRSQKKNDIIWEFFPNVGPPPHPPLLGTPYPKKNLVFILHFRT